MAHNWHSLDPHLNGSSGRSRDTKMTFIGVRYSAVRQEPITLSNTHSKVDAYLNDFLCMYAYIQASLKKDCLYNVPNCMLLLGNSCAMCNWLLIKRKYYIAKSDMETQKTMRKTLYLGQMVDCEQQTEKINLFSERRKSSPNRYGTEFGSFAFTSKVAFVSFQKLNGPARFDLRCKYRQSSSRERSEVRITKLSKWKHLGLCVQLCIQRACWLLIIHRYFVVTQLWNCQYLTEGLNNCLDL